MKLFKKILKSAIIIVIACIVLVLGYCGYVLIQYYRIDDNLVLEVENNTNLQVETNTTYTIASYNIGFGAYDQEYSFFLDEGTKLDGTVTTGIYSKAVSKEHTVKNTEGAIETIKDLNVDFALIQEVDKEANRSYFVNQYLAIQEAFPKYSSIYASNLHTAYLLYPFNDMMGKAEAGLVTLSKYHINNATRYSLPLSESIFDNLFDLDRSFMMLRIPVLDKELVIINIHMSAYDEGGKVRAKQMQLLNEVLEKEKDNYVIVGGDFNHILDETEFPTEYLPETAIFDHENLNASYKVYAGNNAPTCRGADISYEKGVNKFIIIDGFICNQNVEVIKTEVIDTEFKYSDHNPTVLTFKLK